MQATARDGPKSTSVAQMRVNHKSSQVLLSSCDGRAWSSGNISRCKYQAGNPARQNTVVAECRSRGICARAECNRNFGEGSGSGKEVMRTLKIMVRIDLTATVAYALI